MKFEKGMNMPSTPVNFAMECEDFIVKAIKTMPAKGWQARIKRMYNILFEPKISACQGGDIEQVTLRNYVYAVRKDLEEAFKDLDDKDPRIDLMSEAGELLIMPDVALIRGRSRQVSMAKGIELFGSSVIERIHKYGTTQAVENWLAEEWAEEIKKFSDKTANTRKLYISKYRKWFKICDAVNDELYEWIIKSVRFPDGLAESINRDYKKSRKKANANLVHLPKWKALVKVYRALLKDENPRLVVIGLMGVTGRRFVEIMSMGTLTAKLQEHENVKVVEKWMLCFQGQAKTRQKEHTQFDKVYNIPLLAPAKEVLDAFNRLRNSVEGAEWAKQNSEELNAGIGSQIARQLLRHPDIKKNLPKKLSYSLKTLRPIYAEIVYSEFAPDHVAKHVYFAQILGHLEEDIESALSYMRFTLKKEDTAKILAEKQRLAEIVAENENRHGKNSTTKTQAIEPDDDVIDNNDVEI